LKQLRESFRFYSFAIRSELLRYTLYIDTAVLTLAYIAYIHIQYVRYIFFFSSKTLEKERERERNLRKIDDDVDTSIPWRVLVHPKNLRRINGLTSIIFLLVRDSWGSLYSVYLRRTLSMSVLAYWYSLLLELKIISAISQSHSTDSSYAFFITPNFRLLKVTCRI